MQTLPQEELDFNTKQILQELKVKDSNGSYFKNLQSIDKSINQELTTIDTLNFPINDGLDSPVNRSRTSLTSLPPNNNIPNFKSPLSKELEGMDLGLSWVYFRMY